MDRGCLRCTPLLSDQCFRSSPDSFSQTLWSVYSVSLSFAGNASFTGNASQVSVHRHSIRVHQIKNPSKEIHDRLGAFLSPVSVHEVR